MKHSNDITREPAATGSLPAAKRQKIQQMAATLRSKLSCSTPNCSDVPTCSAVRNSAASSFATDPIAEASHLATGATQAAPGVHPTASTSALSGSACDASTPWNIPDGALPVPQCTHLPAQQNTTTPHTSQYDQPDRRGPEVCHKAAARSFAPEVPLLSGDCADSDSEGSAIMGAPILNPLHILATQGSKVRQRVVPSDATASSLDPHKPAAPTGRSEAERKGPSLAQAWVCRQDLSATATGIQAAGSQDAATHAQPVEGLADSKKTKRKSNACYPYGNYHRYYGYRLGDAFDEDPRLQALDATWFSGKSVLDIGCNEGVLTLSLTCKFGCKSIMGVDIDNHLIKKASRSLSNLRSSLTRNLAHPELASGSCARMKDARSSIKALKASQFSQMDFVNDNTHLKRVDTVLCLSVTKWVHFNWGDEGVKRLFAKVMRILQPGGLFILEPQPWRSYKQVLKKQETLAALPIKSLAEFQLRPDQFANYLVTKHNFKLLQQLEIGQTSAARGFDRGLLVFQKR